MPNIKFDDTGVSVKYLEAFLQNQYNNSIRVSGIYDVYTHNNLIDYMNLRDVLFSEDMITLIVNTFSGLYNIDLYHYFEIYRVKDSIELRSKDFLTSYSISIGLFLTEYKEILLRTFARNGWMRVKYNATLGERVDILFEQSIQKRLIPKNILSCINLHCERYLLETDITGQQNTSTVNKCVELVPCKPNTEYLICFRFGDRTDINSVDLRVAWTTQKAKQLQGLSIVQDILPVTLVQYEVTTYTTGSSANTLLIEMPYDLKYYGSSLLVIERNGLPIPSDPNYVIPEFIKEFDKNYWNVYSKFLDYLFGMAITPYDDKDTVYEVQVLLSKLYGWDKLDGIYDDLMLAHVKDYQRQNNIEFAFGYLDVETESKMRLDIDKGKFYYMGG